MVVASTIQALSERIARLYTLLDANLKSNPQKAGRCKTCGRCCNFEAFGHRLFVTTIELAYLAHKLRVESLRPMTDSICPYNSAGLCTVYEHRFVGCRVFCCSGEPAFQNRLSESAVAQLKSICRDLHLSYRYLYLPEAIKVFNSVRWEAECRPAGHTG